MCLQCIAESRLLFRLGEWFVHVATVDPYNDGEPDWPVGHIGIGRMNDPDIILDIPLSGIPPWLYRDEDKYSYEGTNGDFWMDRFKEMDHFSRDNPLSDHLRAFLCYRLVTTCIELGIYDKEEDGYNFDLWFYNYIAYLIEFGPTTPGLFPPEPSCNSEEY